MAKFIVVLIIIALIFELFCFIIENIGVLCLILVLCLTLVIGIKVLYFFINERVKKERLEKLELWRQENERLEKERLERLELWRQENERLEKERSELERQENERLEKERLELWRQENERLEKERLERLKLESDVLTKLGISFWNILPDVDIVVNVQSRKALEKYDDLVFFKEDSSRFEMVEKIVNKKNEVSKVLQEFLKNNDFKEHKYYYVVEERVNYILKQCEGYKIHIDYISSAGNYLASKDIWITLQKVNMYKNDPTLLMAKNEYNKYLKEQEKEQLANKYKEYYGFVNSVIDYANENKDDLFIKGSQKKLDDLMLKLFDRTVNSIKKIKTIDSEEWGIISDFINNIRIEVEEIVNKNKKNSEYYKSKEFAEVKESCEILMSSQREFNEYINEKVEFVSKLFGHKVFRNSTVHNDEYNYIRPYKKTITPLSIEVSAGVFASAENDPMKYIVKYFYPDKTMYKDQINKLYILVEELETIKEAKQKHQ